MVLSAIEQRIGALLCLDKNTGEAGEYAIRSIYFDDIYDTCFLENENGTDPREKFRIRFYNGDLSYIVLEKKIKVYNLCKKEQAVITESEARELLSDDTRFLTRAAIRF